ncbi:MULTISPECIES: glycosyl hydrolase family 18 protein [Colwellia]|uniref:Chitinase n=1 Tax=Colwellia marinimaniae TaxID=1513592 RepID=A0ABQ0MRL8_9GAMM|nr:MULTISPECIES: glycosyl hydrolase family 18 protein [Colwellia]GAW95014.1 chitinase [Colwellia marinimaniae]
MEQIIKINKALKLSALFVALLSNSVYAATYDCSNLTQWQAEQVSVAEQIVKSAEQAFKANWWNKTDPVTHSGEWQEWQNLGTCAGVVVENSPPTVSIISPAKNSSFFKNDSVVFSVFAADEDGSVTKIALYLDDVMLTTLTSSPYQFTWSAVLGEHLLKAIAFDDKGAQTSTENTTLTVTAKDTPPVNEAPTATLMATLPSKILVASTINFEYSATDSDGQVTQLSLLENGVVINTIDAASGSFTWTATALGPQAFTVAATDDQGATALSNTINFTVVTDGQTGNDADACRPEGLYQTPGVNTPYCTIYDQNGRELMGVDHPRRIIGYFTSWRNGANNQPSYLVNDIPWDKVTHINYAFAHIDANNKVSIGEPNSANNPATNMEWPGVVGAELDPSLPYKGHFNLLNKYKKLHPKVKTLISVGGWAETGGHFADNGRVADGGFYTLTTNADGTVNHAAISAFSASAVEFIEKYGFDGVDIDYEYPSSMADSGHPDDFSFSNARRAQLNASYQVLMKSLRESLDIAGEAAGKHYLLTIASPSSGYLLRGMETFQATQYLDYVNIMSYDLHGAWNSHVGHNASLFDTGLDSELAAWDVYGTKEFEGIGYLNTDWAVKYFRGGLSAGRINIGIPYYTRGFKDVTGGTNGLWGQAVFPDQANCPKGTGKGDKNSCGNGAVGIDNLWHDTENDREVPAGSNPLWHIKNLEKGIVGSYSAAYGLDPVNEPSDKLTGTYTRYYDSAAIAPWLWNDSKKVFISIEDEESMATKVDYVIDRGLGGVMFWELAGDFDYDAAKGEYFMGSTMTTIAYDKFNQSGTAYGIDKGNKNFIKPAAMVDVSFAAKDFPSGDDNYPISPTFAFTNNSTIDFSGAKISFDVPVSTSAIFKSNWNATKKLNMAIDNNASNSVGNNIGGFENDFHRFSITLTDEWGGAAEPFAPGQTVNAQVMYYMPISGPVNFTIEKDGKVFAFKAEYPSLPEATSGGGDTGGGSDGGNGTTCDGVDVATLSVYPEFPQKDWAGNSSHANQGDMVVHNNAVFKAKWWTNSAPGGADWDDVCSL